VLQKAVHKYVCKEKKPYLTSIFNILANKTTHLQSRAILLLHIVFSQITVWISAHVYM